MKKALSSTLLFITLFSCSKKDSDFVGEYNFKVFKKINVKSNIKLLFEGKNYRDNAKRFDYLSKGIILIYKNDQTNQIDGELRYLHGYAIEPEIATKSKFKTKRFDFELNKFRIKGDTLFFNLKNTRKKLMTGYILKKGNENLIGFENSFFDNSQETNPWYYNKNKNYTSIKEFKSKDSSKVKAFYKNQIDIRKNRLKQGGLKKSDKRRIENSVNFIEKFFIK